MEQWSAQVLDRLERALRLEDDRVEVKRQLPADPLEAARRIAGHANQARSDRILWLIGVVEDPQPEVVGQAPGEPDAEAWWSQVEAKFDEVAPAPTFVHTALSSDKSVLGIGFETTRPPYVVKLPHDRQSREVPWREGTRVRSANRFDLLRLLTPVGKRPRFSLLQARVYMRPERPVGEPSDAPREDLHWQGHVEYYIDCEEPLILPDHRSRAVFVTPSQRIDLALTVSSGGSNWSVPGQPPPAGRLAARGDGQLVVNGSAAASFSISGVSPLDGFKSIRSTLKPVLEFRAQTAGLDPYTFVENIQLEKEKPEAGLDRGMSWRFVPQTN